MAVRTPGMGFPFANTNAYQAGTWTVAFAANSAINVSNFPTAFQVSNFPTSFNIGNFPATQQVGGTVTANLGTLNGAATSALQTTGNTALSTINSTLGTPLQQGGPVTSRGSATGVTTQVAVSATTATQIVAARAGRQQVKIIAHEGVIIFYGFSNGVTKTTGFRVPGVEGASIPIDTQSAVWAIANNATTVSVMELY